MFTRVRVRTFFSVEKSCSFDLKRVRHNSQPFPSLHFKRKTTMTDDDPPSREKKQRTDEHEKEERQKVVSSPLWELIVNNDDISCFHILPKLNGTDIKFLYEVNGETRKLIERSSRKSDLKEKFRIDEMSSICTLEFAWENKSLWRFARYFLSVRVTNKLRERTFCAQVARTNKLDLLKWIREEKKCKWGAETIVSPAERGNLEIVKYCVENGCPIAESACKGAACHGHLELLKYLHETGGAPLSEEVSKSAASRGHIDVLRYLAERDCPMTETTCYPAAINGHFECLKYILEDLKVPLHVFDDESPEQDRLWDDREDLLVDIAANGHLEVLRFLHEEKNFPVGEGTCAYACEGGHLECVKYLHEDCNVEFDINAMEKAVGGGPNNPPHEDLDPEKRYQVVRYIVEKTSRVDDMLCTFAATSDYIPDGGGIPMLQFLRSEFNAPWSTRTTAWTAQIDDLKTLKYLVENGCPVDENAVMNAAEGKVECLKYLLEEVKVPLTPECLSRPVAALQPGWFLGLFEALCLRYFFTSKCSGWKRYKDKRYIVNRDRADSVKRLRCLGLLLKHKCPGWEEHKKRLSRYVISDERALERYQSLTDAEKERLAREYLSGDRYASSESESLATSDFDTDGDEELLD